MSYIRGPDKEVYNPLTRWMPRKNLIKFEEKYYIGKELGRGGFGVVFEGVRKKDRAPVAVKYVNRSKMVKGQNKYKYVPLEAEIHKTVDHLDGVADLLEIFDVGNGHLIITERPLLCADLYSFNNVHGPISENKARDIFFQVVNTLIACQNLNVVHRDIKEDNLVIDLTTGRVLIIDWGSAAFDNGGEFTNFPGTRYYMPPEWFLHQKCGGSQATVWSLGVLLYSLLHCDFPYPEATDLNMPPIRFSTTLSARGKSLINACLHVSPAKRATLFDIMDHPFMRDLWEKEKKEKSSKDNSSLTVNWGALCITNSDEDC